MTTDTWARVEAIATASAAVVAIGALLYARGANRTAKKANEAAEVANGIAREALGKADKANEIAEDANQLSQDANTTARRSVTQKEEHWFVDWDVNWDRDACQLVLENHGANAARETTFVVTGKGLHEAGEGVGDVPEGEQFIIALPEVGEQRDTHEAADRERMRGLRDVGWTPSRNRFSLKVKVTVNWRTGEGFPQTETFEQRVS